MKKSALKLDLSKYIKNTEETYAETNPNKFQYTNTYSRTNPNLNQKIDFLDSLAKESRKDSFINILVKESMKINQTNNLKKKLNEINLKEDDIEGLYDWSTLFNNSRPLSHYTRVNYKEPKIEEDENDINDIKSPKILVDLPNDKMQFFFGKNSFGNNSSTKNETRRNNNKLKKYNPKFRKNSVSMTTPAVINTGTNTTNANKSSNKNISNIKSYNNNRRKQIKLPTWHFPYKYRQNVENNKKIKNEESKNIINYNRHIKPTSIYSNYGPNNTFYYSDTFSNYYKEDLKSFTKKMPILKAKIKTKSEKLKKEIKKQKNESYIKEKILYDIIQKDNLIISKQDLIISAERRNPVPLMKSIFRQENPNVVEYKEHVRKYFNTMKPYGNDDGKVDYRINDRWRLNKELIKFRKMEYKLKKEKEKNNIKSKIISDNKGKLILNYYDINDPDLDIFNKLNLESIDNNNKNILNYSFEFRSKNHLNKMFDNNEIEEKIRNKTIDNEKLLIRPKTGFKSAKEINILKHEKTENNKINRPHSSNLRRNYNNMNGMNNNDIYYFFDIKDYDELYKDYLPSNRFPLKTDSKVNNISYNKINQLMKERFYKKKLNENYFITEPNLIIKSKMILPEKKYSSYNSSKKNVNINTNKINNTRPKTAIGIRKKQKCNVFDFNKYIETNMDLKMNKIENKVYFEPMNCFNKLAGKYYSSSNNVHIKNKRNKRKEILDFKK